jgi:cell division control protein 6
LKVADNRSGGPVEGRGEFFRDKLSLDSLSIPEGARVIGRNDELGLLTRFLSPIHNNGLIVPFISVYGKSGTGKSAAVYAVCKDLASRGLLSYRFVNMRKATTVFGCANAILHSLGGPPLKSADGMSVALENIARAIEDIVVNENTGSGNKRNDRGLSNKISFVLVLDEFDVLFSHGRRNDPSDFVFAMMLIVEGLRSQGHLMSIIAISNRVVSDYTRLDERVRSRVGSSEIYFLSYTTQQLVEILKDRQARAFWHPVDPAVIEYCATVCARHSGDARRAIDLLRRAAEIAMARTNIGETPETGAAAHPPPSIEKQDVDSAFEENQKDRVTEVVKRLPAQVILVIGALTRLAYLTDGEWHSTSILLEQYEAYVVNRNYSDGMKPMSRRRFAEALTELENVGLVESKRVSEGRYGSGINWFKLFS